MPLMSKHFKDNDRLQECLISPAHHVVLRDRGGHVALIQKALEMLGVGLIDPAEIREQRYGVSTAEAVRRFKGPPRNIINWTYQSQPDNIVGKMTIERLDLEMQEFDRQKHSRYVSETRDGQPHDHRRCPRLQAGDHELTPINPQQFGAMVNFYGDHETDYLGFKDYAVDPEHQYAESGQRRPLSWIPPELGGLCARSASDICMRSVPVYEAHEVKKGVKSIVDEIRRIAMPGCRITFAGEPIFAHKITRLGPLIERVDLKLPVVIDGRTIRERTASAWVVWFLG